MDQQCTIKLKGESLHCKLLVDCTPPPPKASRPIASKRPQNLATPTSPALNNGPPDSLTTIHITPAPRPLHKHAESQEKKTVRQGPVLRQAWATRGTKRMHVANTCPHLTPAAIVATGHQNRWRRQSSAGSERPHCPSHDPAPFPLYNQSTTASRYISDHKDCGQKKKPGKRRSGGVLSLDEPVLWQRGEGGDCVTR